MNPSQPEDAPFHAQSTGDSDPHHPDDHPSRMFPRFTIQGRARIRPALQKATDSSPSFDIYLRDIGRSGIGFLSNHNLSQHTLWTISFLQAEYVVAEQSVQIRHAYQIDKRVYSYGAQFTVNEGLMSLLGIQSKDIARIGPDEPAANKPVRYEILPGDWSETG